MRQRARPGGATEAKFGERGDALATLPAPPVATPSERPSGPYELGGSGVESGLRWSAVATVARRLPFDPGGEVAPFPDGPNSSSDGDAELADDLELSPDTLPAPPPDPE